MTYKTYWVPREGADLVSLKALHNKTFPGNELAIVYGYVKVAVPDGWEAPANAVTAIQLPVPNGNTLI